MKIEIITSHYYFKVLIEGLPHVTVEAKDFKGFTSWNDSETHCSIEWVTRTNKFKTKYDSIDKWKEILKALNEAL